ncbi:DUF6170 family protein [Thalassotalea sp. PLHSN55]|uniref:DUF6170 family protein n=1 Tax=Thalassotalea sp. PLHSN55 TaxID=3435888 RepID=UPI003F87842A
MALYFSTNQIPQLRNYSVQQRQAIVNLAMEKLTAPEKFVINVIKLLMLIPPFLLLANLESGWFFVSVVAVLLAYFFIMKPISLSFAEKYIEKAIKQSDF